MEGATEDEEVSGEGLEAIAVPTERLRFVERECLEGEGAVIGEGAVVGDGDCRRSSCGCRRLDERLRSCVRTSCIAKRDAIADGGSDE